MGSTRAADNTINQQSTRYLAEKERHGMAWKLAAWAVGRRGCNLYSAVQLVCTATGSAGLGLIANTCSVVQVSSRVSWQRCSAWVAVQGKLHAVQRWLVVCSAGCLALGGAILWYWIHKSGYCTTCCSPGYCTTCGNCNQPTINLGTWQKKHAAVLQHVVLLGFVCLY